MLILAIDPGNEKSAYVVYNTETKAEGMHGILGNHELLGAIEDECFSYCEKMAIEMPACYGMAVGKTVFDTCRWVGVFQLASGLKKSMLVYRKSVNKEDGIDSVVMCLCKNSRANDSNVRQAIIDRYPATGGGKTPQIGTKSKPGPLYGVSKDVWSALAVAITFEEKKGV